MILGVKKSNLIIYCIAVFIAILLLLFTAVIIYKYDSTTLWDEVLLSLGCSTIPTVVIAYLIDYAAEKRDNASLIMFRKSFLWGMPHGLVWIAKVIIEKYITEDYVSGFTYKSLYEKALSNMKLVPVCFDSSAYQDRDRLFESLDYGLSLCIRDCKAIIDHSFELEIKKIFSKDELIIIRNLHEDCITIKNNCLISEIAEYIDVFTNEVIENIPEIKSIFEKKC